MHEQACGACVSIFISTGPAVGSFVGAGLEAACFLDPETKVRASPGSGLTETSGRYVKVSRIFMIARSARIR
jgi:hypothetical protein